MSLKVNRRSDVQGELSVELQHGQFRTPVPAEVWQTFFRQRQGYSSEKMALHYAVEKATKATPAE
jgi:hypothetical protein